MAAKSPKAKRAAKRKTAAPAADASAEDPRFAAVLEALAADARLAPIVAAYVAAKKIERGKFGTNALKVGGKLFAMMVRGKLVLKLSQARVDELVDAGGGARFEPAAGRVMKQWLVVGDTPRPWVELVREAHAFVAAAARRR